MQATEEARPVVCTLDPTAMEQRLASIRTMTMRSLRSYRRERRALRLVYQVDAAEELMRIVELERNCCAFLDFTLVTTADDIVLVITAPIGSEEAAQWLFEQFVPEATTKARACGCSGSCG